MKCLNIITFKRGGELVHVPCGKCIACCNKKSLEWQFRLREELKANHNKAIFVTLTYNNEHLPLVNGVPSLNKRELQNFFRYCRRMDLDVRYFAVGEYGGMFQRPHYHIIMFNLKSDYETLQKLQKCWTKGFVQISEITNGRIRYVTKYMFKFLRESEPPVPEFALCSKRPYLGSGYLSNQEVADWHVDNEQFCTILENGVRVILPRLLQEKLFNSQELNLIKYKYQLEQLKYEQSQWEQFDANPELYRIECEKDLQEYNKQQSIIERMVEKEKRKKEEYLNNLKHVYIQKFKTQEV